MRNYSEPRNMSHFENANMNIWQFWRGKENNYKLSKPNFLHWFQVTSIHCYFLIVLFLHHGFVSSFAFLKATYTCCLWRTVLDVHTLHSSMGAEKGVGVHSAIIHRLLGPELIKTCLQMCTRSSGQWAKFHQKSSNQTHTAVLETLGAAVQCHPTK